MNKCNLLDKNEKKMIGSVFLESIFDAGSFKDNNFLLRKTSDYQPFMSLVYLHGKDQLVSIIQHKSLYRYGTQEFIKVDDLF